MPTNLIFHKGYALTLCGFCDNYRRLTGYGRGMVKRFFNLVKVIAVVDNGNVPTEGSEFFVNRAGRVNLVKGSVDLEIVEVNDNGEVVKLLWAANIAASQT